MCGVWFDSNQASEKTSEIVFQNPLPNDHQIPSEYIEDFPMRNKRVVELSWKEQEELDFLKNIKVVDIVDLRAISGPDSIIVCCKTCGIGFSLRSLMLSRVVTLPTATSIY